MSNSQLAGRINEACESDMLVVDKFPDMTQQRDSFLIQRGRLGEPVALEMVQGGLLCAPAVILGAFTFLFDPIPSVHSIQRNDTLVQPTGVH